jgi:hypothetical protein
MHLWQPNLRLVVSGDFKNECDAEAFIRIGLTYLNPEEYSNRFLLDTQNNASITNLRSSDDQSSPSIFKTHQPSCIS